MLMLGDKCIEMSLGLGKGNVLYSREGILNTMQGRKEGMADVMCT